MPDDAKEAGSAAKRLRVAVTGAGGMLGRAVVAELRGTHEVLPLVRADCDLADTARTRAVLAAFAPQAILHCAAWTDVDGCEADPERARSENTVATANVADAARECGARLLAVSTDYVFDGALERPYREDDAMAPLNVYGRTKRAGEESVLRLGANALVVRTSWLFGPGGRNFVRTMAGLLRTQDEVRVVGDQIGSPTYTLDLAPALGRLVESEHSGILHVTNSGVCSWYELAAAIEAELATGCRLVPCRSDEFPRPARRPRNSVLDNGRYHASGSLPLRPWRAALHAYLEANRGELGVGGESRTGGRGS